MSESKTKDGSTGYALKTGRVMLTYAATLSRLHQRQIIFVTDDSSRYDGPFICYQNQQLAARIAAMPEAALRLAKPGPNDPCPCESGKKYKKCCGR